MSNNYNILISKIDKFIRKYYVNELIKGAIYFVALALIALISVSLLEYFGNFGTTVRTVLFYLFLAIVAGVLTKFIVIPLMKLYSFGKRISHKQAALIIGKHFTNVDDKLVNTLQLKNDLENSENELLAASINSRLKELNPIPFNSAIDFSVNKKYLKYAIPPFFILLGILFINADIITKSVDDLVNHNREKVKQTDFRFVVSNENLNVVEQEELTLKVKVDGVKIPQNVFIEINGSKFRMIKDSKNEYSYKVKPTKDTKFNLSANSVTSEDYLINVLPRPVVQKFEIDVEYPSYTGITNQKLSNVGDLNVPEGTVLKWKFNTKNVDELKFNFNGQTEKIKQVLGNNFSVTKQLNNSSWYSVLTKNEHIASKDSIIYKVNVAKDALPSISANEEVDSLNSNVRYFYGEISDDYGFNALTFNYRFTKTSDSLKSKEMKTVSLGIRDNVSSDQFVYLWNLDELNLKVGEEIDYYFTVYDNDGINGSKSRSTSLKRFKAPTKEEIQNKKKQSQESLKNELAEAVQAAKELQDQKKELQNELSQSKSLSWQQEQKVQNFLNQQKDLEKKIEDIKQKHEENKKEEDKYLELSEEYLKKREELDKLMEELLTDEIKELMKEIQELLEQGQKDKIEDKLDQMELDAEQMEKQLDRALEQYKQYQFQEKLQETLDELEELKEEQKELQEETDSGEKSDEELKEKQEELKEKFDDVKKNIEELEKQNEDLENKKDMPNMEEEKKSVEESMEKSSQEMEKGKSKKSSKEQQKAQDAMKQMQMKMQQMQAQEQESSEEDMNALRMLLENLVKMSFDQEDLMDDIKGLAKNDPQYFKVGQKQKKIKDDAQVIKDSLFALSKRQPMISGIVNKEIGEINYFMQKALDEIGERQTSKVRSNQQTVMTSTNNLALLLDEILQQMQQQMMSQMSGSGSCNKPGAKGKGKPGSTPSMSQMQSDLKKQLEKMKKGAGKGSPGGKKPGDKGKNGQQGSGGQGGQPGEGMSEQLAKLAAQQAAIREHAKKMRQQLNQDGSGNGNQLNKAIDDMEEIENDIINNQISDLTLKRQKDILTRLLEHEKADRERDLDEKREAEKVKNQKISNPNQYLEYKRKKEKEIELLKTIPPSLRKYYKNKVNEYFNTIE